MPTVKDYKRTRRACFFNYLSMSAIFSLPSILFVTFREMYGISYTLLGTLVLINFCTQLIVDLIFTFFNKHFNIKLIVKAMPLMTSAGLFTYAVVPMLFPDFAYVGLVIGTFIFSVAAGFNEVLLSPIIAALPSDNSERDMSTLHSLYAYGVVSVVVISTVFLKVFGTENWMYLTMFFASLQIVSFVLFCSSPIPNINVASDDSSDDRAKKRRVGLALCLGCIFLGAAAENAMTSWISGYVEKALNLPKEFGDVFGMALFAVLIGVARTLYAKFGKNISKVLLWSMIGATACYIVVGFTNNVAINLIACVLIGFCTSMLWPGTLIYMEEQFPACGVAAYALMAAGGDFGASVSSQSLGMVIDAVTASEWAQSLSTSLALSPDQIGMRVGMIFATIFPILGTILVVYMRRYFKKTQTK